jgi:hypothetical protein
MMLGCPASERYAPAFRGKPAVARLDRLNSPRRYICIRCNALYCALTRCTVRVTWPADRPAPHASHCGYQLVLNGLKRLFRLNTARLSARQCDAAQHVATQNSMLQHRTACCNAEQHVATQYNMLQRSTTNVHACLSPVHHPHVAPAEGGGTS